MKLSSFFPEKMVRNDTEISYTNYVTTSIENSVVFALDRKNFDKAINNSAVSAIITNEEHANLEKNQKGLVISKSPKKDFFKIHNYIFNTKIKNQWKHSVSKKTKISNKAIIENGVIIESGVEIEDFALIKEGSILRKGVFVGSHAVVGARGLHDTFIDDERVWVCDSGGVLLEEGVQILSHATIQKPYFHEMTIIGKNTIISLHANIGHGCQLGKNSMVAGHAQLAGYVKTGNNVWIGPSSSIAHNVEIGDSAEILIGSNVISNVKYGQKISGSFAINHSENMKSHSKSLRKTRVKTK
ncbi:hypothetical protein QT231_05205 [Halomonas sp. SpR1]|uniref:hypothetical protein n=1 Tax=Halomonas sp. SpR1 TaxID=3050462 RepID=UPI0027E57236|nr:hypothetical protein [Halomonas sp. SpR1]MDQ7732084.1 hypothetical protein [Halomonas sp. SpR1]